MSRRGGSGGSGGSGGFDSVPADDSFRNYMTRKIELQRRQFGLVLPPPPSPPQKSKPKPSPPTILKKRKARSSENHTCATATGKDVSPNPQFAESSSTSNGNPVGSEKKSVRFHHDLEIGGVSQVLINLKQKHGRKKLRSDRLSSLLYKRRHRKHNHGLDAKSVSASCDTPEKSTPTPLGEASTPCTSILGVLDNLQKRYGASSSKKRRQSSVLNSSRKRKEKYNDETMVTLSAVEDDSVVPFSEKTMPECSNQDDDNSALAPSKMKRDGPRYSSQDRSVLEGLKPTINNGNGLIPSDDLRNSDCFSFENDSPAVMQQNPSSKSFKVMLAQMKQPSPAAESSQSPPKINFQGVNYTATSHMLPSELDKADAPTKASHFRSTSTPMNQTTSAPSPTTDTPIEPSPKPQKHRPDLFFIGVVVLVNGHTSPDATTLMRLLHRHGGDLEKYETRRVTHIIATQLSVAKANIYKRQKNPTPVCRPEWITDSVEAGKLLPFGEYLLEDVRDDGTIGTKSVKSFFKPQSDIENKRAIVNRDDNQTSSERHGESIEGAEKESFMENSSSSYRWHDTHPSEANYQLNGQVRTVGNDPNFLDSYFSNSRLSYIGSFKQRLKATSASTNVSNSSQLKKAGAAKFVLLVDMDCFFASVALRKYPQYRNRPVAVGHAHSAKSNASENEISVKTYSKKSSSELSTCNYIARAHGIKKGMFLGDAIQLCPELVVLPYDFNGFEEVSGIVADLLHGYAERYNGAVEQVSCDELYVEINIMPDDCQGIDAYGVVKTLAEHIRADIVKKTECTASIGIGHNKFLAKLAADKIKPNASCVVKDWREFLEDLSLRDIPGIGYKFQKKLQPHGLGTVNDIWDLGDDAEGVLGEIIGQGNAHKIVQYCYGKDDRAVTPVIRKSIGAECNYGVRFDGPYGVDYMIEGLAKEVEKRMTGTGVKGSKLTLKIMKSKNPSKVPGKFLGHGSCDSISRTAGIPLTRDKNIISSAAMKLYDKLGVNKNLIRGMGLVITSLSSEDESNQLISSPSKLSAWLKGDSVEPTNSEVHANDLEECHTSSQLTFSIEDDHAPLYGATTFSQLDQDVLHNLPEDILSEVKSLYGKKTNQHSSKSPMKKNAGKCSKSDRPIPIPGQTSVRRMLKLACIKSGEEQLDEKNVSLTQLVSLPLEVQLQIANGDDISITRRQKPKGVIKPQSCTFSDGSSEVQLIEMLPAQSFQKIAHEDATTHNFHKDNITPIQEFISLNQNPDSETVNVVKDFLLLCISEKRIDDAVTFLRAIKNMQGGWNKDIYLELRKATLYNIYSTTGSRIDNCWLGI